MTRLENEKFKRYCHEKGFRGDHTTGEVDAVEYDIFMWYIIIRRDLILPAKSCEKVARFLERTFRYYILFTYLLFWSLVCEKRTNVFQSFSFLLQNCEIGKFGFIFMKLVTFLSDQISKSQERWHNLRVFYFGSNLQKKCVKSLSNASFL